MWYLCCVKFLTYVGYNYKAQNICFFTHKAQNLWFEFPLIAWWERGIAWWEWEGLPDVCVWERERERDLPEREGLP